MTVSRENIDNQELIEMKEVAKILGLKYHTARKIVFNETSLGVVDYGRKKLWVKRDILDFKRNCYIEPVA